MEAKDAWLLFAGAFLGFIGSLLATFAAPSIGNTFGKLKAGFIERNRATALARYALVRGLRSGKRDKYLYAIRSWGFVLSSEMLFVGGAIISLQEKGNWLLEWSFLAIPTAGMLMFMIQLTTTVITSTGFQILKTTAPSF